MMEIMSRADDIMHIVPPGFAGAMEVIINDRNAVVIADLKQLPSTPNSGLKSIGIIYGGGHMMELEKSILAMGFKEVGVQWTDAISLDVKASGFTPKEVKQIRETVSSAFDQQDQGRQPQSQEEGQVVLTGWLVTRRGSRGEQAGLAAKLASDVHHDAAVLSDGQMTQQSRRSPIALRDPPVPLALRPPRSLAAGHSRRVQRAALQGLNPVGSGMQIPGRMQQAVRSAERTSRASALMRRCECEEPGNPQLAWSTDLAHPHGRGTCNQTTHRYADHINFNRVVRSERWPPPLNTPDHFRGNAAEIGLPRIGNSQELALGLHPSGHIARGQRPASWPTLDIPPEPPRTCVIPTGAFRILARSRSASSIDSRSPASGCGDSSIRSSDSGNMVSDQCSGSGEAGSVP